MIAALPLVITALPALTGLVREAGNLIEAFRAHPQTPAEIKAQLDGVQEALNQAAERVAAVQFRQIDAPPITPEGMSPLAG